MKKIILMVFLISFLSVGFAQTKGKGKKQEKTEKAMKSEKIKKEKAEKMNKEEHDIKEKSEKKHDEMKHHEKADKDSTGKKGKEKVKNGDDRDEDKNQNEIIKERKHEDVIWEGTEGKNGKAPKATKRTPNKVGRSFNNDYPNAANVSWTKYRGDWTATFGNGLTKSTAVYHANGDRRDTRTVISKDQIPLPVIQKAEEKQRQITLGDIIKIDIPGAEEIYRSREKTSDKPIFRFFNKNGREVKYDY
jgi:hypothetical protein